MCTVDVLALSLHRQPTSSPLFNNVEMYEWQCKKLRKPGVQMAANDTIPIFRFVLLYHTVSPNLLITTSQKVEVEIKKRYVLTNGTFCVHLDFLAYYHPYMPLKLWTFTIVHTQKLG